MLVRFMGEEVVRVWKWIRLSERARNVEPRRAFPHSSLAGDGSEVRREEGQASSVKGQEGPWKSWKAAEGQWVTALW